VIGLREALLADGGDVRPEPADPDEHLHPVHRQIAAEVGGREARELIDDRAAVEAHMQVLEASRVIRQPGEHTATEHGAAGTPWGELRQDWIKAAQGSR